MRLLAFLMAVLIMGSSFVPCGDPSGADKGSACERNLAGNDSSHDSDDACSPLCVCGCCASFAVAAVAQTVTGAKPVLTQTNGYYRIDDTEMIALPVWQPPQLA